MLKGHYKKVDGNWTYTIHGDVGVGATMEEAYWDYKRATLIPNANPSIFNQTPPWFNAEAFEEVMIRLSTPYVEGELTN